MFLLLHTSNSQVFQVLPSENVEEKDTPAEGLSFLHIPELSMCPVCGCAARRWCQMTSLGHQHSLLGNTMLMRNRREPLFLAVWCECLTKLAT